MKVSTTLLVLTFLSFTIASQAQVKKGGLFGFGRGDESELSSELFPNADADGAVPVTTIEDAIKPPKESPAGFNIFKGGQPKKVDNVSYTIQDGQRIETAAEEVVEEKKKGLFSFGKEKADELSNEVIPPIPSAPSSPTEPVAYQTPTVSSTGTVSMSTETLAAIDSAADEAVEKKGGLFGMFGKKKDSNIPTGPSTMDVSAGVPAGPETNSVSSTSITSPPKPAPAPAPREVKPIAANAATPATAPPAPAETNVASNTPIPEFQGSSTAESTEEKKEGNFLMNPINKLRPSKKASTPLDLTGAETIIQNGEIVAPGANAETKENSVADNGSNMPRQAPQVVNGTTTYSSWEDVEGTTRSAAEKILRQMR